LIIDNYANQKLIFFLIATTLLVSLSNKCRGIKYWYSIAGEMDLQIVQKYFPAE